MDLTHDQLERYLIKIFTGSELVYINDGSRDICIKFKQPNNAIMLRANLFYDKAYKDAVSGGMLTVNQWEKLIKERNIFTDEDQRKINGLKSKLEGQEVLLAKTVVVKANQDRIKGVINRIKSEINQIESKKTSKLILSVESKAQEEKSAFLCSACSYYLESDKLCWDSYEIMLKETNLIFKDKILINFLKFLTGIDTKIIRYIARNNLWRIRYITSQKISEPLFGRSTSDYTSDMLNLAYWSNFYQNIYEMLPEDRPSELVIEDDEALDAYMKFYYEEKNREDAARRSKQKTQGKLSAFDKEEVIVTQSNELYQDIKYDKPREAQRIKNRTDIKKRTRHGKR